MTKLKELVSDVFKKLGIEDDLITILKGDDEAKIAELKADEIVNSITEIQKEILVNDPDVTGKIAGETTLKIFGKREQILLQEFSEYITKEELEALPKADRYDKALKLVKQKIKAAPANADDKDKEIERLSAAAEEWKGKYQKAIDEEIPKVNSEWEQKWSQREIDQNLASTYRTTLGGKLVADEDVLYPAVYQGLTSKFDVKSEDGKIVLYEKGKTVKALKNSKPLSLNDAFTDLATEKKIIKQSDPKPDKKPIPDTPPSPKKKGSLHPNAQKALEESSQ